VAQQVRRHVELRGQDLEVLQVLAQRVLDLIRELPNSEEFLRDLSDKGLATFVVRVALHYAVQNMDQDQFRATV